MEPYVRFALPDGSTVLAGANAIVGRSPIAQVRLDDPRVSTIHAELSWRDGGFVLLARGGRVVVGGRAAREVAIAPGVVILLVPGVSLEVLEVVAGHAVAVAPTAGRGALRWRVAEGRVAVHRGDQPEPIAEATGTPARVLAELLAAGETGAPWDRVAAKIWPDDARIRARTRTRPGGADDWTEADERRLRNRWDQQLTQVRRMLDPLRPGALEVHGGLVVLHVQADDVVDPPRVTEA